MIIKSGICSCCDNTVIGEYKEGMFVPNENYSEFRFVLNNGTVATHGICNLCHPYLDTEKVLYIFGRIIETWKYEMSLWGATDSQYERVNNLSVESWGTRDDLNKFTKIKYVV